MYLLLARLQTTQDLLSEATGCSLSLMDSDMRDITIPSGVPLLCFQDIQYNNNCKMEMASLLEKSNSKEEPVIYCCYKGLYSVIFRTNFELGKSRPFVIAGRTSDKNLLDKHCPLIVSIYSLPVVVDEEKGIQRDTSAEGEKLFYEIGALEGLTPQEIRVFNLIILGFSNKDIAERLFISVSTVKTHVSNILSKLKLSNRTDVIFFAVEKGLVKRK